MKAPKRSLPACYITTPVLVTFTVALDALLDLVEVNGDDTMLIVAPSCKSDCCSRTSVVTAVRCQPDDLNVWISDERTNYPHHSGVEVLCPRVDKIRGVKINNYRYLSYFRNSFRSSNICEMIFQPT